jgi:RNA polymerase sigma-70 factor (ECF subfamily)
MDWKSEVDKAFEILVKQYRPMLLVYVSALLYGDTDRAEDVVQESFLLAHQRLSEFPAEGNFPAWLRKIAQYKTKESQRASQKKRIVMDSRVIEGMEEVFAVFDTPAPCEESHYERMKRWLDHCVNQLALPFKQAVSRVYREGLSLRAAAAAERISFKALAKRLSRARDAIRKCIQSQSESES